MRQGRAIVAAFVLGAALFTTVPLWGQDINTLLVQFLVNLRNGTWKDSSAVTRITFGAGSTQIHSVDGGAYLIVSNGNVLVNSANLQIGTGGTGRIAISSTAPTIGSGFGTTPSIAASNGTAAFTVNVGTGGTASSGVITMPTATTGWNCHVENRTGVLGNVANQRTMQIATTTTSVTVENQTISTGGALAWTASDVLALMCLAY